MRILIFTLFVFASLKTFAQNFTTQKGGHTYTLSIPNYLLKTYELNDVATLQYMNALKEAYVIVIDDEKEHLESLGIFFNGPTDFLNFFIEDYMVGAKKRKVGPITEFESNGNKHAQLNLSWQEDNISFQMIVTTVETKKHFYKILCWSDQKNIDALRNDFLTVAKSLQD